jgi:two-component system cell cycle sensor histidine kinase/response regulator CckA
MVESSDDAIIGSTNNIVQSWNRGAEKLFGYTSLEMIDRPISVIVPSSRPGEATDLLDRLNRGEAIRHYETVRVKKDGTSVDVSLTISAIRDPAGHILGASSVARDITERKRAEEALRVSEERYRHLFEQSPDAMLLYDATTLAIIEVNEAAVQQYGYSHLEFAGLTLKEIRPAGEVPRLLEYAARPVQPDAGVWRHQRKDGSAFHVDVRVYPFTDAGRGLRFAAVRDISERLGLEDRLRQAQKMDAIGQLAGGVAHDFNNLLTAILGYAHMVSEALEEGDARRIDVQEIINAGNRAAALTKQLLAFSRKQVLQTTIVDLNALINHTSQMLRRLIGEHIELVTALAADLAPVRADYGQLEQIVINLAVNARDAMPGGGRLSIETANVELDDSYALQHFVVRPGRYVMLAVSDSGVGMNEDTKQRLFEPFFTTKEQGKGTGLGLSTVYGIVKQSEGYIWVYSEPGRGAAFKVYLPRTESAAEPAGTPAPKTLASGGSEKVLVVEDEQAVRYLTRVLLERSGYRVMDAGNPREAEAVFSEQAGSIDLLLTDVVMPGSNGPALFKRLAERQPGLKVLYMSGYTDDTIVREGRLDTDGAFIQKPFTADGLMRKVREVLDR